MSLPLNAAAFGEVMLRLSAPGCEGLLRSSRLETFFGGAEANVASGLAALGHGARMITALPQNAIGEACAGELRRAGLDTGHVLRLPGRMGLYFHTGGAMRRPAEIVYDRAGSAFAVTPPDRWEWQRALDGVNWLHLSGITPALGPGPASAALAAARCARAMDADVSFDFNYRPLLWAGREDEAGTVLRALAGHVTVLFASAGDLARIIPVEPAGDPHADFDNAASRAFTALPELKYIASTFRQSRGTLDQTLHARLATREGIHEAGPEPLSGIVERIGGGDAFAAGVIDGLARGAPPQDVLTDALTLMAIKHSMPGDMCAVRRSDIDAWREGRDLKR